MILTKSFSYNNFKFSELDDKNSLINVVMNLRYNPDIGIGFKDTQQQDNQLIATLISRSSTFIDDYNSETGTFEKRVVNIFTEVQFSIDFKANVIYVFGAVKNLLLLKRVLKKVVQFTFEMTPINLGSYKVYEKLKIKTIEMNVVHLCLEKFNYKNGIVGKFSGAVLDQTVALELLEEYKNDTARIALEITYSEGMKFIIHASSNGGLRLIGDEEFYDEYFNFLTKLIF